MKKLTVLTLIFLLMIFTFACNIFDGNKSSNSSTISNTASLKSSDADSNNNSNLNSNSSDSNITPAVSLTAKDFFPILSNVRYRYEGKGNEYAAFDITIDYFSSNKFQERMSNGGTEIVSVIEIKSDKIVRNLSRGEIYYRENFLNQYDSNQQIVLKNPVIKGTSWTLADNSIRTITSISDKISTKAGDFDVITVTTIGSSGKTLDYYAKDVGLVKSVFTDNANEISSTLASIEKNYAFVQTVRFFYPNINDGKYYFIDKEINLKTNDKTAIKLQEAYKGLIPNQTGAVFTKNTIINSLTLGKDQIVHIDLNKAFMTEMNAGSGYEGMILQSIANTFGNYYNVTKVILTIDGKLYESSHFSFKEGEFLTTKLDNIKIGELPK